MAEVRRAEGQGNRSRRSSSTASTTGLGLKEAKDAVEALLRGRCCCRSRSRRGARRLGDAGVPALEEAGRRARPPLHDRRRDGPGRRGRPSSTRTRSPTRRPGWPGGRTPPGCASGSTRTNRCRRTGSGSRWDGEDPRIALREDADLTDDDVAALDARLERLDRASSEGAWTMATLDLIRAPPAAAGARPRRDGRPRDRAVQARRPQAQGHRASPAASPSATRSRRAGWPTWRGRHAAA